MFEQKVIDRFETKVTKQPSGCWEWNAGLDRYGYGIFSINGNFKFAHRFAYENATKQAATGKLICHHCDNRKCVNPAHLFEGTSNDNMKDMVKKGRSLKGVPKSAEHNAKNSAAHLGKKLTDAHKKAISEGRRKTKDIK